MATMQAGSALYSVSTLYSALARSFVVRARIQITMVTTAGLRAGLGGAIEADKADELRPKAFITIIKKRTTAASSIDGHYGYAHYGHVNVLTTGQDKLSAALCFWL